MLLVWNIVGIVVLSWPGVVDRVDDVFACSSDVLHNDHTKFEGPLPANHEMV